MMRKYRGEFDVTLDVPDAARAYLAEGQPILQLTDADRDDVLNLKSQMLAGDFDNAYDAESTGIEPITVKFFKQGSTSAVVACLGNDQSFLGCCVMLPRIDTEDDAMAIESARQIPALSSISPESFDDATAHDGPLAAMFFCDVRSANSMPLRRLMAHYSIAFFGQFGVGSE